MLEDHLIQIAGVSDAAEAQMLQQCGVRYLAFPLRLPVHRGDLTESDAMIIKSLPPGFPRFRGQFDYTEAVMHSPLREIGETKIR